jgi:hypothetical protein
LCWIFQYSPTWTNRCCHPGVGALHRGLVAREIGDLCLLESLFEFSARDEIEQESVADVGGVGLFVMRAEENRVRVQDRLYQDLLVEAVEILVLGANDGKAVAALRGALRGIDVSELRVRSLLDPHDEARALVCVGIVGAVAFRRDLDRALILAQVVAVLIDVLIYFIEREAGPAGFFALRAIVRIPGIAVDVAHVDRRFVARLRPGGAVIAESTREFL